MGAEGFSGAGYPLLRSLHLPAGWGPVLGLMFSTGSVKRHVAEEGGLSSGVSLHVL